MILSREQLKKVSKEELNNYKHLVMNIEHLHYEEDKQVMIYSIEILNYINNINSINNLYKGSNSDLRIQTDIFYKAIQSIQLQNPFTDAELKQLYQEIKKVEYFYETMLKFIQIDIRLSFDAEFILFGLEYATYVKLNEEQKAKLHENYGDVFIDYTMNNLTVDEFLTNAKKLIETYKSNGVKETI